MRLSSPYVLIPVAVLAVVAAVMLGAVLICFEWRTEKNNSPARSWFEQRPSSDELLTYDYPVNSVALSPDGRHLATATGQMAFGVPCEVRVWNFESGRSQVHIRPSQAQVDALVITPDGMLIGAGSRFLEGGRVPVQGATNDPWPNPDRGWRIGAPPYQANELGHAKAAFSRTHHAVSAPPPVDTLWFWELRNGREIAVEDSRTRITNALAISPDGKVLAIASRDTLEFLDPLTRAQIGEPRVRLTELRSLAFSPDGKQFAAASHRHRRLQLIETDDLSSFTWIESSGNGIWAVAFTADSRFVVLARDDGVVDVVDPKTNSVVQSLHADAGRCFRLAARPGTQQLAAGYEDFSVRIWDVSTGEELLRFEELTGICSGLVFTPDGSTLVGAMQYMSKIGQIKLWHAETGQPVFLNLPRRSR